MRTAEAAAATAASPVDEASSNTVKHGVPAALHARACCALVGEIAEHATQLFRMEDTAVRTVLLPVLQCTAWASTAVSSQAVTALDKMCHGAPLLLLERKSNASFVLGRC